MSKKRKNPLADSGVRLFDLGMYVGDPPPATGPLCKATAGELAGIVRYIATLFAGPMVTEHALRCPQCAKRLHEILNCVKGELKK